MGAYIVGLNKPENEKDCNFYEEVFMRPFPYCHLIHKSCAGLEHCPIIEIREPHGDLIDASEKIRVQMYDDEHEDFHTVEMTIDDLLSQSWVKAYAYPIIPASESKERPAFLPQYELTPRSEEG